MEPNPDAFTLDSSFQLANEDPGRFSSHSDTRTDICSVFWSEAAATGAFCTGGGCGKRERMSTSQWSDPLGKVYECLSSSSS
jgi:hypothetical protein